jgi:hypothetical protein
LQKIPRKAAPPQDVNHPPTAKMTYPAKAASLVQNFAARWCSIHKHLIQSKTSNQEQQCKTQLNKKQQQPTAATVRNPKTTKNHTEKQDIISETHLTAIGVCTTIRPENSGI